MTDALLARIDAALDPGELERLVLDLAGIAAPQGREKDAGDFVFDWMAREGFAPRRVGAVPHRFNVIGAYGGRAAGRELLFSSHLDTEGPVGDRTDAFRIRPDAPLPAPVRIREGVFEGAAVANDRGPMSCFLMAAKVLRRAGIALAGRMILTACPGEIGPDPMEEVEGIENSGKDVGALWLLHHGGVAPDFMIAAEGTDWGFTSVGSGYAIFRIRLFGEEAFTPVTPSPARATDHPNPIYRLGAAVEALNAWGRAYEAAQRYESTEGAAFPRVQIGAVRGGVPHAIGGGTAVCALWLEVGMAPGARQQELRRSIATALTAAGFTAFDIQADAVRHGAAADPREVAPLRAACAGALAQVRGAALETAHPVYSSMWRDHNVFNLHGVPSATIGPPRQNPTIADLVDCVRLYAMTTVAICGTTET